MEPKEIIEIEEEIVMEPKEIIEPTVNHTTAEDKVVQTDDIDVLTTNIEEEKPVNDNETSKDNIDEPINQSKEKEPIMGDTDKLSDNEGKKQSSKEQTKPTDSVKRNKGPNSSQGSRSTRSSTQKN